MSILLRRSHSWWCLALLLPALLVLGQGASAAPPPTPSDLAVLPARLRFEHLGLDDGLSQNAVLSLLQDRQGFLWIGTQDGLNRYDGYNLEIWKHDPNDPTTLSHSSILSLYQDQQGLLWIGTWGGGLNRLDPTTGAIQRYRHDDANPASLSANIVTAIHEDRRGQLWIATMGGGLERLDRSTGKFTHLRANPDDAAGLSSDFISTIYEDRAGYLWLGSGGFGNNGAGLMRFDPRSGQVVRYRHDPGDPASLSSDNVSAIVQDAAGQLWVGTGGFSTAGSGLNRLDPASGRVQRFTHRPDDDAGLSADTVMGLHVDSSGRLWISTWGGGLDTTDPLAEQPIFAHHQHDAYDPQSLSADILWSILEDRSGVMWFGSVNGGLNKLNPQVQRFELFRNQPANPSSLGFDVIGMFYEDPLGGYWVGTWGGGLDFFDPLTNQFTHYVHDPNDPTSLPENTIGGALRDRSGQLWISSFGGISRFDPAGGKFETFAHDPADPDSLMNNSAFTIIEDDYGRLWIGTLGGLDVFDRKSEKFIHIDLGQPVQVVNLHLDRHGDLWAGTWEQGLFRFRPDSLRAGKVDYTHYTHDANNPNSLSANGVWVIHEDQRGNFWFGTQNGLDRMDPQGQYTHFTERDGLPNNTILCLLEDRDEQLWVSTNNGLARFNPALQVFRTYDGRDGLQSNEFNSGACMQDSLGRFYFGGVHGFNRFDPLAIADNPLPPPLALTAFRVFNEAVPVDPSGQLPIRLDYRQNYIAFEFTALDFHAPHKNRFAYKLDGFDQDWVQAGERRYAGYTNLRGGDYVFRVRASNNDGVWNETGLAVPVIVSPPFWQAWWFRSGVLLLIVALFIMAWRVRVQSVEMQNRRLEVVAAERTAELRRTNQRLEEEINQRQKAEEALMARTAEEAVAHERTRLARDLHDAVTQTLFSASLIAEVLPELWRSDRADAEQSTEELRQLTRGALAEMRTLLLELRPAALTQTRFEDLLRQLAEALIGRARLPIALHVSGTRDLPPDVQVALYRIVQESLNNVVKYAKATQVVMDLQMGAGGVHLTINDNGVGFDPTQIKPNSLGQRIMRERADSIEAELTVESAPGQGTTVTILWTPAEDA